MADRDPLSGKSVFENVARGDAIGPPARGLVAAIMDKNGKIYYGNPGELHFEISQRMPHGQFAVDGFATPTGQFLTRSEAAAAINHPDAFGLDTGHFQGAAGATARRAAIQAFPGAFPVFTPGGGGGGMIDQEINGATKNRVGRVPLG